MGTISFDIILAVVNFARAKKAVREMNPTRIRARTAERIMPPNFSFPEGFGA